MKRFFLLTLIAFFTIGLSFAQENEIIETEGDGLVDFKKMNKASDRLVFELFFNHLTNKSDLNQGIGDNIKVGWYSRGLNVYFTYDIVLGNSPISIAPGIGVGYNNYYNNGQVVYDSIAGSSDVTTRFLKHTDETEFKKNKLSTTYIDIPVELRFRTRPNEKNGQFKVALGARFGVLVKSHLKYKGDGFRAIDNPDETVKFKEFNVKNLERIRYGVSARVGYGAINVFGTYYISDLFKDGLGPNVNPYLIGIAITGL